MCSALFIAISVLEMQNIHAVVGPFDHGTSIATEELEIPYLSSSAVSLEDNNAIFQLIPDKNEVNLAMLDLIKVYGWKNAGMFYDSDTGESFSL